jgi:hypothetical protein
MHQKTWYLRTKYMYTQVIFFLIMKNVSAPVTNSQMETVAAPCPRHIPQSGVSCSEQTACVPQEEEPTPVVIVNPTDICNSRKAS